MFPVNSDRVRKDGKNSPVNNVLIPLLLLFWDMFRCKNFFQVFLTKVADMPKEEFVVETPAKGAKGKKGRVAGTPVGTTGAGRGRPPATVSSTVATPVATTTGEYGIIIFYYLQNT